MAARLAQVEQLNHQLSAQVSKQSEEIVALRAELDACQPDGPSARPGSSGGRSQVESALRSECDQLKSQINEMMRFLSEYGLKWIPRGTCDEKVADGKAISGQPNSKQCQAADVAVDIKVLESRVEGLNALLDEEPRVVHDLVGPDIHARLSTASASIALPLTFFREGVKLADQAFMPFESHAAQTLIKEILDGCFPRVLKDEHPGGIPLKVVDRTSNSFKEWLVRLACSDPELADGGERLRPMGAGRAVCTPADVRNPGERFLAKLPERVIRNGKVCEIRGPIAEKLGLNCAASEPSSTIPVGTNGTRVGEVSLLRAGRDSMAPTARLQVKLEGGQRVLLCMEPSASVRELWAALVRWRAEHGIARFGADGKRCTLRTAFPPRDYTDFAQSLEAAGLTPSATLFVSAEIAQD